MKDQEYQGNFITLDFSEWLFYLIKIISKSDLNFSFSKYTAAKSFYT